MVAHVCVTCYDNRTIDQLLQWLIEAAKRVSTSTDSISASAYLATLGTIFFAVPHRGMDIGDMARKVGEEAHPRTGLIQQIDLNSEDLRDQLKDLRFLLGNRKVVTFYETQESRRVCFCIAIRWRFNTYRSKIKDWNILTTFT